MDRVFLDANVLFSAAYRPHSRLRELWSSAGAELVTSELALEEAHRNLAIAAPHALAVLDELCAQVAVAPGLVSLPAAASDSGLPNKDEPILAAAIAAGCTHLLTGDLRHFGHLYGRAVHGVLVQTPAQYLRSRKPG